LRSKHALITFTSGAAAAHAIEVIQRNEEFKYWPTSIVPTSPFGSIVAPSITQSSAAEPRYRRELNLKLRAWLADIKRLEANAAKRERSIRIISATPGLPIPTPHQIKSYLEDVVTLKSNHHSFTYRYHSRDGEYAVMSEWFVYVIVWSYLVNEITTRPTMVINH
jgi:hypothetical protein